MKKSSFIQTTSLILIFFTFEAFAQGNSNALSPNMVVKDACRSDVSKFEEAIGYLRQVQGNEAAAVLKEKLMPAKLENEILFKDGYCGLARHLREKKLIN
jgi:hypothetical protein